MSVHIQYDAPPTVSRFLDSDAPFRLIVGPVGSGKSSGCNMEFLRRATEQRKGKDGIRRTRFVAIRNTYPELRDTTQKTFEQWIPDALGKWNKEEFSFHMRFKDVDCEVLFRALDKPKDVKKLLSLDLSGAYINEAREVPKTIFDGLKARVGRFPPQSDGGASWSGIWMDTNPMHVGHELYKLFKVQKPPGHQLFEQPDALGPKAENLKGLPPGYYATICQGQDEEWIDEYVRAKYPKRDKGSVYGELLAKLLEIGALSIEFEHPTDGLFCNFDLGVSDATAMWTWRPNAVGGADFVDHYENSNQPLEHFFEQIDAREEEGWRYLRFILPHDARARTLQTGGTVMDRFMERYPGRVEILPALSIEDGISAFRWLLQRVCRFHARCDAGLEALKAYKYQWDPDRRVYSRKPLHDWTSHTADAGRYVALYIKRAKLLLSHKEEKKKKGPPSKVGYLPLTLDELYEAEENS